METNNIKKLPLEPRLPMVGSADYDQQLSRALYEYLRIIASNINKPEQEIPPPYVNTYDANIYNAADYGTVAAAYAAAVAGTASTGGRAVVFIPSGTTNLGNTFTVSAQVDIVGVSRENSIINCEIVGGVAQGIIVTVGNFNIRDVHFYYANTSHTVGAALMIKASAQTISNVKTTNAYDAFSLGAGTLCGDICMDNILTFNTKNDSIRMENVIDVHGNRLYLQGQSSMTAGSGWHLIGNTEGSVFTNCSNIYGLKGINIDSSNDPPSRGSCAAFTYFIGCLFDTSGSDGIIAKAFNLGFTNCWFASHGATYNTNGFTLYRLYNTTFTDCTFAGNYRVGAAVSKCNGLTFTGCNFNSNSNSGSSTDYAMTVYDSQNVRIHSCGFNNTTLPGFGNQINGVYVDSLVTGFIKDCPDALLSTPSSYNAAWRADNIASATSNKGFATIAAGASTLTINHGLIAMPHVADITITPVLAFPSGYKVDTITASSFRVVAVSATDTFNFGWSAKALTG